MPHYYPIVIQSGHSLAGDSLGFHAYSLRIDNLTNQWLLEETSLAWIPPYSLGVCLRLYGTGVAIILNQAPAGQPQPAPLAGEASVGVYSDQLRTEVAGTAVRQFTLIQAVSDLSQGAMPAFPPVGTDRLWADNQGNIHHLHSDGTDYQLVDAHNAQTVLYPVSDPHYQAMMSATALGADLSGTVNNGQVWLRYGSSIDAFDSGGTRHPFESVSGNFHNLYSLGGGFSFLSLAATTVATLNETGTFNNIGNTLSGGSMAAQGSARTGQRVASATG